MSRALTGKGARSPQPLTDEQRTLLADYRKADAELVAAQNRVRDLTDHTNRVLAQLQNSGLTVPRLMELLTIPTSQLSRTRLRIEGGRGLLDAA